MKEFTIGQFRKHMESIEDFIANHADDGFFVGAQVLLYSNGDEVLDKHGDQIGIWDNVVSIDTQNHQVKIQGAPGPSCPYASIEVPYDLELIECSGAKYECNDDAPQELKDLMEELGEDAHSRWEIEYFYVDGDDELETRFMRMVENELL